MTRVAEIPNQVTRIWRHRFQSALDSALEQQMRAQALAGVQPCWRRPECRGGDGAPNRDRLGAVGGLSLGLFHAPGADQLRDTSGVACSKTAYR